MTYGCVHAVCCDRVDRLHDPYARPDPRARSTDSSAIPKCQGRAYLFFFRGCLGRILVEKRGAYPVFDVATPAVYTLILLVTDFLLCLEEIRCVLTKAGGDAVKRKAIVGLLLFFFFLSSQMRSEERWVGLTSALLDQNDRSWSSVRWQRIGLGAVSTTGTPWIFWGHLMRCQRWKLGSLFFTRTMPRPSVYRTSEKK